MSEIKEPLYKVTITNGIKTVKDEVFREPLEELISAVIFRTDFHEALNKNLGYRMIITLDSNQLGTYYFESGEFYPSSYYENNPEVAKL